MNILWLSWKDETHPLAGGAEFVSNELRKRLVNDGHNVVLLTARANGQNEQDTMNGVRVYRTGNRYTVYKNAKHLYMKNHAGWADLVIDEMNTIPFFGFTFEKEVPCVLLTYQLARAVWFYQMRFPFSYIGYLIEPLYLRFISHKYDKVLTESISTKIDLQRYGFEETKIDVFRVGMRTKPLAKLPTNKPNRVLFVGSIRPMKRTLDAVKAFEIARDKMKDLFMDIIGDNESSYGKQVLSYAESSRHSSAITFHGKVSDEDKESIMKSATVQLVTSVKEGWGLIVTEAAARGIVSVAYDVDGLRDSLIAGKTGLLAKSGDIQDLAEKMLDVLNDPAKRQTMRHEALKYSKQFTFENSFSDFKDHLGILLEKHRTELNE